MFNILKINIFGLSMNIFELISTWIQFLLFSFVQTIGPIFVLRLVYIFAIAGIGRRRINLLRSFLLLGAACSSDMLYTGRAELSYTMKGNGGARATKPAIPHLSPLASLVASLISPEILKKKLLIIYTLRLVS